MPSGGGRSIAAVALVLLAGLGLRLWGIGYGLPFVVHPDENRQVLDALGMAQRMSPVPAEFSYPALHKYLLVAADGAYYALGLAAGWFKDPADFALKFLEGESRVILVGRLLSVAAGIGVCLSVWKMATRLFSRSAGIFALVFSAGMFHLIQHSQWAISDIFLALFTTLALFYIMLSSEEGAGSKKPRACLSLYGTCDIDKASRALSHPSSDHQPVFRAQGLRRSAEEGNLLEKISHRYCRPRALVSHWQSRMVRGV